MEPLTNQSGGDPTELSESISGGLAKITAEITGTRVPSVPVYLPPKGSLAVRLVDERSLRRLDELRKDSSLLQSALWTMVGALLGFVGSLALLDQSPSRVTWLFLSVQLVFTLFLAYLVGRSAKRSAEAWSSIYRIDESE